MTRFVTFSALIVAFLVLRGWPGEWGVWSRSLVALLSLTAALISMSRPASTPKAPRFKSARKSGLFDWVGGAAAITLSLAAVYLLLASGPAAARRLGAFLVASTEERSGPLEEAEEDWSLADADLDEGYRGNVSANVDTSFNPDGAIVPRSTNPDLSDTPKVSLKMEGREDAARLLQGGAVYVTAFSHDTFDGYRWTSQEPTGAPVLASDREGRIYLRESEAEPAFHYTVLHGRRHERTNTVVTLQSGVYVRLPEVTKVGRGVWRLPPPPQDADFYRYEAGSTPRRFEDLFAAEVSVKPGTVAPAYQAPADHPGVRLQIRNLAAGLDGNTGQNLTEIQQFLRQTCSYSLTADFPDNGKSALENFLETPGAQPGFCVHFASAAALLAREIGVPSRISYGWTGGVYYESHHEFVFRSRHSHAWAEIFLDDYGWVVFDTTPPVAAPDTDKAHSGEAPPAPEAFVYEKPAELDETVPDTVAVPWRWVLVAAGFGLMLFVIVPALRLGRRKRGFRQDSSNEAVPFPGYFKLFHQACNRLGYPMPVGRTLRQHLEVLKSQGLEIQFADDLLRYHYDVTYRNRPRNAQTERRLRNQIKAW